MPSRAIAARNKYGITCRYHPDDQSKIVESKRELAEAKIADYIEKVVAEAPPLTDEQRDRIAALLRAGAAG
jgi:hypothetical protein